MKNIKLSIQIAMIFIGSIVGAGVCSGRELNQFFATYGSVGFIGLILCGILYVVFSRLIINITAKYNVSSYDEFVDLVCPKWVAKFTNLVLTLFLFSSTSIILAGSGSILYQYFGIPRWIGVIIMFLISSFFLMRNTEGLFEVNSFVVPTLVVVLSAIFIFYIRQNPHAFTLEYIRIIPRQKTNLVTSTLVYVSFNILTIIGVIVPLTNSIKKPKQIIRGVILGSIVLTLLGSYIMFLMLVNPFHPTMYEIPLLAIAMELSPILQIGMLAIMWLEMFSSQVSNVYSLSYYLKNRFNIAYNKGIFLVVLLAAPFSMVGFAKLVEVLYPMYGVLSLVFLAYCVSFMIKSNKEDYTKTKLSQDGISQTIDKNKLEINTNKNSKNKIGKYLKARNG
ncbi:MAG: transporter [Cellulosilyticum sp.]|nr:transporter [Cellulosilyticum sp.]